MGSEGWFGDVAAREEGAAVLPSASPTHEDPFWECLALPGLFPKPLHVLFLNALVPRSRIYPGRQKHLRLSWARHHQA